MNKAKARDFFSDYYEGSLDPGLKEVFERALENDPSLKEDYSEFTKLMKSLDNLAFAPVPEPAFLSERIESRIEARLKEQAQPAKGFWWMSWGRWAFAGAAAVAVIGLILAQGPSGGTATAGFLNWNNGSRMEIPGRLASAPSGLLLEARTAESMTVTLKNAATGDVLETIELEAWQPLASPLANKESKAVVMMVEFSTGQPALRVAVPGEDRKDVRKGAGTLDDLARALADTFGKPVQIESPNPNRPVVWELEEGGPVDAAVTSLRKLGLTLEERAGGLLFLN